MASSRGFAPEIVFEDDHYTHQHFIHRILINVKELKDMVCETKKMYADERIRSNRIIEALSSEGCNVPGFPDASTIPEEEDDGKGEKELDLHMRHVDNLTKIDRFIEIIHDSEIQHENGRCLEKFKEKRIKLRSIVQQMRCYLGNNGLVLDDTDSDSTDSECYNRLKSMKDTCDRFHRDYVILKDTEKYCDDMICAYSSFSTKEEDKT